MVFVTVFRRVPTPIIGVVGRVSDPAFLAFEATLDWLETTGAVVERIDPQTAPEEVAKRPVVSQILGAGSQSCLPLVLINDTVVSRGRYLTRAALARAVGDQRRQERPAA